MAAKKSSRKASGRKKSTAAKKSSAKKSPAKKSSAKKSTAKKAPAKKSPVKTVTAEVKSTAENTRTAGAKKLGAVIEAAGRVIQRGAEIVEQRRTRRKKT